MNEKEFERCQDSFDFEVEHQEKMKLIKKSAKYAKSIRRAQEVKEQKEKLSKELNHAIK